MDYQNIFDQTADWQKNRLGKFTASEIGKLMGKGRGKADYFGEKALTYIKGRLAEIITQEPVTDLEGLKAIEWGNANEMDAVLSFEKAKGVKVQYFGKANPQFFPYAAYPELAGGSPDGLMEGAILEVKAPYNSTHHVNYLLISDAETLKAEKPDYYAQVQFNMICTGTENAFFVSYDPRVISFHHRLHIIEVPLDEAYCIELKERIEEAVKLLNVYLECLPPSILLATADKETGAVIIQ